MVSKEHVGVAFRQLSIELRWVKDKVDPSDPTHQVESRRPYDEKREEFGDSDEAPTLVTFAADDNVDVDFLLKVGAIQAMPGEKGRPRPAAAANTDVPAGEGTPSPEPSPKGRG
jgi:hypothetical protein